ncbi:transposase [Lyngbya sp. CCY1209]|uniref:RNA-guided endonuclease InsQ/TnpB family protein n=1 Tax=Lyngbya sp. CCY1209 TaxID=2886103 RepID=UPI002D216A02|nr:transposase [Lyngbya sp. CCY1209]MEB3886078.1 transposase [Lyngbya sp. CCY1209]
MNQLLTIVCKLQPTPEQAAKIDGTLKAFADACIYIHQEVNPKTTSKTTIQAQVYHDVRAQFGLSANLAVRACARVSANRKTAKQKSKPINSFASTSADYDARIFSFREKDWTVSLTTIEGRERMPVSVGNYQRGKLKGSKPTSAQLCQHRDGCYYIHIQVKSEPPEPRKHSTVIGVDFGRTDIAVTSEGDKWDGKQIRDVRDRFSRVRASLQRKGTKGAKRALKRLSGRERRFQAWVSHNISKTIVKRAVATGSAIAIEDLTGIRQRTNKQRRTQTERRRSNSWAFYQLRQFISYKALAAGVSLMIVPPAYTSQTCHQCLHIGIRASKRFNCTNCGWHGDADLNGSLMISILGDSVSSPERLSCSLPSAAAA